MRLMHFSSVVLPELAGPMIPKICRSGISSDDVAQRGFSAVAHRNVAGNGYARPWAVYHFFRERR